ncbi:lysosome membrane protein 2-A-like isoform X1 [Montipora capricornis]|uniref:lysosome membrane protein 2-A-like isoform X1 n=1 Tax=Montipora capricornis TaxID=246305 RepID=UPI0035F1ED29
MCSKKVAGIIAVIIGVVLVVIGITLGVVLTNMIQKAIEEEVCVNNKESPGYKRWEGPTEITTKVYFWNITNRDAFLYRSQKPRLKETGPYVYTTKAKQVGVKFENGKLTSTSFDQITFNKTLTKEECPKCSKHDQVTVLNSAYLGLMKEFGSAKDFSIALIPLALKILFKQLTGNQTGSENSIYIKMGQARSELELVYGSSNPAFGSWVRANYPSLLHGNFSVTQMRGLYGALMNASKFGPFSNPSLLTKCTDRNTPNTSIECGLVINLNIYIKTPQLQYAVKPFIDSLLCPDSTSCFNTSLNTVLMIAQFVTDPLPKFVMRYLDDQNYGLTATRKQSDISLGYVMTNLRIPPRFESGIPVPGILTSHDSEIQAKATGTNSTFYTCESSEGDRFAYAAIGGENKVNQSLYPNATEEQLKVHGYYSQFPGQKGLKPCTTDYRGLAESYPIFLPQFRFAVPVTYKRVVEVHSIPMHRYVLRPDAVNVNNVTVFKRGIFDVTRLLGGPLYISLPGFLHGDPSLYNELKLQKPRPRKYGSYLNIEPVSGTAMQLKLRIQLNGVITSKSLFKEYHGHSNVSFVNKFIPIWWSETSASIDEETAEEYNSQLFGSLRLSCGLVVALPLIGGILLILGIIVIVYAVKKNTSSVTTD